MALVVAACGGGSDEEASSESDVNELLKQTFTGSKEVKSGNLELSKLKIEATGGEDQLDGPVSIRLAGPFEAQEGGKLPKFELEAAFEGAGQSITAGATSTGEKGFLSFQGSNYVVDDQVFKQFKAGFEEAQKQGSGENQSFASLGMDPRKWLTDPKNEGDAKVGDDDTIKITGGIDVALLLDDVNNALSKASSLGLGGAGQVPEKLTEEQKRQVTEAVKDPRVEIYTGKEDKIMRRMVVNLGVDDKSQQHHRHGRSSTSRSRTSTRTRRSPSRATPSRSASCSASSAASGSAAARRAAAAAAPTTRPPRAPARPRTWRSSRSASPRPVTTPPRPRSALSC